MRILVFLLTVLLSTTSCNSTDPKENGKDALVIALKVKKQPYTVSVQLEEFMNGDGLVNRIISVEYPNENVSTYTAHVAHYSDVIVLKDIQTPSQAFLIAEDKTGYTVWDISKKKIVAQSQEMEKNTMVDSPVGTAEDFMTHQALTEEEWLKILKVDTKADVTITQHEWKLM